MKLEKGESISDKDSLEIRHVIDKLEKRDIELVHTEMENDIGVWLLCRTNGAVLKLLKMKKDGRLEDIIIKLFSILLKREVRFTSWFQRFSMKRKKKLTISPTQFREGLQYFKTFGNQLVFLPI